MSRSSLKSKNKLVTPELTIHLTQFRYSKFSSTSNPTSTSFWMSCPPFPLEICSSIDPRRTPTQSFLITIGSRTMPLLGLVPKISQIRTRLEFLPLLFPPHMSPDENGNQSNYRHSTNPDEHSNNNLLGIICQTSG